MDYFSFSYTGRYIGKPPPRSNYISNIMYLLITDVMSLSVLTELPFRVGWIEDVNFNTSQLDVQFKKVLIYLSIDLLKIFPYNTFVSMNT